MVSDDVIHIAVGTLLTVLGFFVMRLIKQLDDKADKSIVDEVKEAIRSLDEKLDKISDTQQKRHDANTNRLDNILFKINGIKNGS